METIMKRVFITVSLLLFFAVSSFAQAKFALTYSIGFPTGETSDYFSSTSWRGVNFDYHYMLKEDFAIGFSAGWQVFSDNRGFVTETSGTETISGYRYNYLNSVPLLATGSYFFNSSGDLSPYASLGIGLTYSKLEEDIGLFRTTGTGWPFTVRPEIGLDYEINYNMGIRTSFRYNYIASGSDLPSLPGFAINVGLVWSM
jgi:hypothetical protein